jgi:hypothetical protein
VHRNRKCIGVYSALPLKTRNVLKIEGSGWLFMTLAEQKGSRKNRIVHLQPKIWSTERALRSMLQHVGKIAGTGGDRIRRNSGSKYSN